MIDLFFFGFFQANALNFKTQPFQQRVSPVKPVKQSHTAVPPVVTSQQTGSRPPSNNSVEINNNSAAGFYLFLKCIYGFLPGVSFVAFLSPPICFSFFLFQLRVTPYLLQICLWMLLLTSLCRLLQDLGLLNLMVCKSEVIRLVSCLFL